MNNRLHFLDNLKVALTFLVIAHHAGQPYGGSNGFWYFQGREAIDLGAFFSVNAGFFMSLFFLISAYFFPASFNRKGPARFLKDWVKRLGLPLLFGFFVIMPLLMYAYYLNFRSYGIVTFWDYYLKVYFGLGGKPHGWTGPSWPDMQFGHLWFIEHLLVYAFLYTGIRKVLRRETAGISVKKPLGQGGIIAFGFLVATATFLIRLHYPIDKWVGFLGIIQTEFAHVPQYAAFFTAGIIAYHRQWLQTLSRTVGTIWLIVGVVLAACRYAGWIRFNSQSGYSWNSLAYSFYETFLCIGLSLGLIFLFREVGNKTFRWTEILSKNAFTVYVLHVPVVVCLQYAFNNIVLPVVAKLLLVSAWGIVLTFALSHLIHLASSRFRNLKKEENLPL
ncbi:acyltransferase [Paenibacillus sp. 7124]|uniref:Acyltransferase n=1 Tax=Paenibacillus apii TaxID=1850370 RepID=A0A6M1PF94_9BACL|nr:acyltransferase [Paenibacillus apii]NGM82007.1 acyltransferase [Paenibacillus apii]